VKLQPVTAPKQMLAESILSYITSAAQFDVSFAPFAASSFTHSPYTLQPCAESGFGRFSSFSTRVPFFRLVFNNNNFMFNLILKK
jgi:hypothetical protein